MCKRNKIVIFFVSFIAMTLIFVSSAVAVVDISEIPLDAQTRAAPANIMFVLDDSGSMDWEIMTTEPSGLFEGDKVGKTYPYEYIFDDPGSIATGVRDNVYGTGIKYGTILTNTVRKMWQSQWFEHNKMYYNPSVAYKPWPRMPDADTDNPRSHPNNATPTFDIGASYLEGTLSSGVTFDIPRAHYYVRSSSSSTPYLVTVDGSIKYYSTAVSAPAYGAYTESVTTYTLDTTPPSDIVTGRTYSDERQNFANWYSFYRRRNLTTIAAVAGVVSQMAGVKIGMTTIQNKINQEVMAINIGTKDKTNDFLDTLYDDYKSNYTGGTPLRLGLQYAGQYFDADDSGNTGDIGTCPYASAADGGECQQSFAILMTDGYYNGGEPWSPAKNVDGDNGVPFADSYSNTLADVAMYYWENDLSSSLADLITPSPVDPAKYQHMVTYSVSFGVAGTLDPATHLTKNPIPPWPDPEEDLNTTIPEKIDDLYHASVNGHGTFLSASNPTELVKSLLDIMTNIKERIGSASSVSVNGDELYKRIDNNTYMFQSSYSTIGWEGDVKSYKIDSVTGNLPYKKDAITKKYLIDPITGEYILDPAWEASTVWKAKSWDTYWETRPIATYDGSTGVEFWADDGSTREHLTSTVLAFIDSTPATAKLILNYVRGDDSHDKSHSGGTFRTRSSRLGDIVHSSPVYHNGILYVGANDGMMHAIRAEGTNPGSELFSYVPSQVLGNLSLLTKPSYAHNYYVDLTVTVQDNVLAKDTTMLVGGLGQGGKGYYALNISKLTTYNNTTHFWDASAISESAAAGRVLWEFPHAGTTPTATLDVADIGYSFSKPLIVRTNDPSHPWVVIFGNGYNSSSGKSVLFILDPADGDVLKKITLGGNFDKNNDGDFADVGDGNGLSTPSVTDVNGDGKADYVYAGDLAGNMWKVDMKDTDIAKWEASFGSISTPLPLFTATNNGTRQPITSKPDVMYHPQDHGYMVIFGTGKFLGTSDFTDKAVQTVYGVWDYGDDEDNSENLGTFDLSSSPQLSTLNLKSTLLEQKQLVADFTYDPDSTVTGDEEIVRVLTDNAISWVTEADGTSGQYPNPSTSVSNNVGWYFELPNPGERVVSRMMIRDGRAIFISFTPNSLPCHYGGNSILHEVNATNGGRIDGPIFDTNGDGVINSSDLITAGGTLVSVTGVQRKGHLQTPAILRLGNVEILYMSSTAGNIETVKEAAVEMGLSSWREF